MHIGLIGGIGLKATENYYRALTRAHADAGRPLALTIVNANLQQMLPDIERRLPAIGEADLRSPGRLVIRPTVSTEKPSTSSTS